jgi:hypothetical protein
LYVVTATSELGHARDFLIRILNPLGVNAAVIRGEILLKHVNLFILVRSQADFSESVIAASLVADLSDFDGLA